MKRSTAKLLMILNYVLTIAGAYALIAFTDRNETVFLLFLGAMLVVNLIIQRFLRCPHCGKSQRRNWLLASYCAHCGEPLSDE